MFTCALTAATSSAMAVPLHSGPTFGDHRDIMVARDLNVVARDILQAIHARELAALGDHTGESTVLLKRGIVHSSIPRPSGNSANTGNRNAGSAASAVHSHSAGAANTANTNPTRPPIPPPFTSGIHPPAYSETPPPGHVSAGPSRPSSPEQHPPPEEHTPSPPTTPPPEYERSQEHRYSPQSAAPAAPPGPRTGATGNPASPVPANSRQYSSHLGDAFAGYDESP
ncbi:hypothetical protein EIP91_001710 [Steccherinum ochraceum]|uniref:Uncharacterized protein n=1 Tax=Steccherinum ochraceum TaxID=92696 RepID=A0A4R0RFX0_9APHY|nr:hypothetical protein EIP91_001710 [Steccherinum ochraceum]